MRMGFFTGSDIIRLHVVDLQPGYRLGQKGSKALLQAEGAYHMGEYADDWIGNPDEDSLASL